MNHELLVILAGRAYKWYDLIFIVLAVAVVFPDACLQWLEDRGSLTIKTWHLLLLSLSGIGFSVFFSLWLMDYYPRVDWWYPLIYIGSFSCVRLLYSTMAAIFRWDEWQ
jgi:hypothetical protein